MIERDSYESLKERDEWQWEVEEKGGPPRHGELGLYSQCLSPLDRFLLRSSTTAFRRGRPRNIATASAPTEITRQPRAVLALAASESIALIHVSLVRKRAFLKK